MIFKLFPSSLVFTLFIFSSVIAQSPPELNLKDQPPAKKESEPKASKDLEQKALKLLDDVIGDTSALKLAENRTLAQATAAALLWKHDEKRARVLFRDALNTLAEIKSTSNNGGGHPGSEDGAAALQLRHYILQLVVRRDPQTALDFLRMTRQQTSPPPLESSYQQPYADLVFEQSLAAQIAAKDPKLALEVAEESLAKGISHGMIPLLLQLQRNDSEAGAKLANVIIRQLRAEDFRANPAAADVALSLLRMSTQPPVNKVGFNQEQKAAKSTPPVLDAQSLRELTDILAAAVLDSSPDSPTFSMLQSVMPEVEKYSPARLPQLRNKLSAFKKTLDPQARMLMENQPLILGGTTESLLEGAAKAPPEMRSAFYQQAAWQAMDEGDGQRARQIINDYVQDSPERDHMLTQVNRQSLMHAASQGKIEEARQMLAGISSKNDRAGALAHLAKAAIKKDQREISLQLLQEASGLIKGRAKNEQGINAQLQVAHAYALVDPARGFEIIEPVISQVNELIAAAAVLDAFGSQRRLFRRGEFVITPVFLGAEVNYLQYSKALARADFDRAVAAANSLERGELRLMARLLIAQSILSDASSATLADDYGPAEGAPSDF